MIDLAIDALATYRLTRLVVSDSIASPVVAHVGDAIQSGYGKAARKWYDELVDCPWCSSVWIAAGVVAARAVAPRAWDPVARLLAFSAVAGVIARRD